MSRECQDCKHSRKWSYEEKLAHYKDMVNHGIIPCDVDRYICDKIPKGTEFIVSGNTYAYDGYSLKGECYDEVFGCFEAKED